MANENVFQLPTLLERLASEINAHLKRDAQNHEEWIEIQVGLCTRLAEARGQFTPDIEFGQWCDANGFGDAVIDPNKRAAAIDMGRDPVALRECLQATTRRSLRHIHREEFGRFHHVVKPTTRRKPKLDLGRPSKAFERAKAAFDELEAKGEPFTADDVAEKAGVSSTPVRRVFAYKQAEVELEPLSPAEMRTSMRKRYEIAVKKARLEIREELKNEVYKELDVFVRHVKERSDRADRILGGYKGTMTKDTFRKIKACLHPDHNTFKFAAEALQAFSELEPVLVKPDDPVRAGPPLPTTAAELMARRRR